MDWTNVPNAVIQLLEIIDDREINRDRFVPESIEIVPQNKYWRRGDHSTLMILARNADGKMFDIAVYLDRNGNTIADGA